MRIIDLTVTIGPGTLSPPSVNRQLALRPHSRGTRYWRASSVDMFLHTGSHVDFSAHVVEGGETSADVGNLIEFTRIEGDNLK
jgi:kynurenine formamidase